MVRDRRRQGGPYPLHIEWPAGDNRSAAREAFITRREADSVDLRAQIGRKDIAQTRHSGVERAVRHHRSYDRPQADIVVGSSHSFHAVPSWRRELAEKIERGSATGADEIGRAELGRHVVDVRISLAAEPRVGVQQHFQCPALVCPFREIGLAVHVRVDEAGDDEGAARIQHGHVDINYGLSWNEIADDAVNDDEIERCRGATFARDDNTAANNQTGPHRFTSLYPNTRSIARKQNTRKGLDRRAALR